MIATTDHIGQAEIVSALCQLNALNWAYTSARLYNHDSLSDFEILQASYAYLTIDPEPGNRTRAHSKIVLSHITGEMIPVVGSDYSQSAEYNGDSGGKIRRFAAIRPEVLATTAVVHLVETHTAIARATQPELFAERDVTIGLHQIRYNTRGLEPSFSSPVGPHSDDEPFVAVILIAVSSNLTGDGNYLSAGRQQITHTLRLQRPLDALLLGRKKVHGVGIMASADGKPAFRDVLLITFA